VRQVYFLEISVSVLIYIGFMNIVEKNRMDRALLLRSSFLDLVRYETQIRALA